jgi:hypothetical protein
MGIPSIVQNIWYFSKLQNDDNSSGIGLLL